MTFARESGQGTSGVPKKCCATVRGPSPRANRGRNSAWSVCERTGTRPACTGSTDSNAAVVRASRDRERPLVRRRSHTLSEWPKGECVDGVLKLTLLLAHRGWSHRDWGRCNRTGRRQTAYRVMICFCHSPARRACAGLGSTAAAQKPAAHTVAERLVGRPPRIDSSCTKRARKQHRADARGRVTHRERRTERAMVYYIGATAAECEKRTTPAPVSHVSDGSSARFGGSSLSRGRPQCPSRSAWANRHTRRRCPRRRCLQTTGDGRTWSHVGWRRRVRISR